MLTQNFASFFLILLVHNFRVLIETGSLLVCSFQGSNELSLGDAPKLQLMGPVEWSFLHLNRMT